MENTETLVSELGLRFIARPDVKAVQHSDGGYHPVREKFTKGDLRSHLNGTASFGHYLVEPECSQCKLFALDLDLDKDGTWNDQPIKPREVWLSEPSPCRNALARELQYLAEGLACRLAELVPDLPIAIADSGGKGLHVYGFTGLVPASEARTYPLELLNHLGLYTPLKGDNFWKHTHDFQNVTIEVFPKQDVVKGDGFGNLMRLPLGRNARTGRPATFLQAGTWTPAPPLKALREGTITSKWLQAEAS